MKKKCTLRKINQHFKCISIVDLLNSKGKFLNFLWNQSNDKVAYNYWLTFLSTPSISTKTSIPTIKTSYMHYKHKVGDPRPFHTILQKLLFAHTGRSNTYKFYFKVIKVNHRFCRFSDNFWLIQTTDINCEFKFKLFLSI